MCFLAFELIIHVHHNNSCRGNCLLWDHQVSVAPAACSKSMSTKLLHLAMTWAALDSEARPLATERWILHPKQLQLQFPLCDHTVCTVICSVAEHFSFAMNKLNNNECQISAKRAGTFLTFGLQRAISCNKMDILMLGVMLTLEHIYVVAATSRSLLLTSLCNIFSGVCVHVADTSLDLMVTLFNWI